MEMPVDAETQTFETMLAGLLEHMHGPARKGIVKQLKSAKDDDGAAQVIGRIAYTLTAEAQKQALEAQQETDIDMLLGVVTELIDSLLRLSQSVGGRAKDDDETREKCLMYALQAYLTLANPSDEERQIAMEALQEMGANGMVAEGMSQIQGIGKRHGVDPFAEVDQVPQKNPMAAGVKKGLMGAPANG